MRFGVPCCLSLSKAPQDERFLPAPAPSSDLPTAMGGTLTLTLSQREREPEATYSVAQSDATL